MLNNKDRTMLLALARQSVNDAFSGVDTKADTEIIKRFSQNNGVFVTLKKNNALRGCIGSVMASLPLYQSVIELARAAAFEDPRFPPLKKSELKDVKFEISILTIPELIKVGSPEEYLRKIKIGRDGLIIHSVQGSGLLLPQVPGEWGWNTKEFLEHTCIKAGLSKDSWKDLNNKIYRFSAEVFSEG